MKSKVIILCFILSKIFPGLCAVVSEGTQNNLQESRGLDPKGLLTSVAGTLLSKGFTSPGVGTSQVFSLNLTNLLVLVLLKALVFAAGTIGHGHFSGGHGGYGHGRSHDQSMDTPTFINEDEVVMFLSYLTGSPGDNGCLQNIACINPTQAEKYVAAGDILLKTSKLLNLEKNESYYQYVLKEIEEAANYGNNKGDCSAFVCNKTNN